MIKVTARNRSKDIQPELYEIRIQGILDPVWTEWFECNAMNHLRNETILSCPIQDQTALHGLLAKIRDMNLILISVTRLDPD
jgi:hypothetical protein